MKHYPISTPDEVETPILGIFMYRPKGIWVVVNVENKMGPVSKGRSLNIILNGLKGFEKFKDETDKIDEVKDIEYFYKENQIVFRLDDQVEKFSVARYIGEKLTQGKFKDWFLPSIPISSYMFYDIGRDKINFVLKAFEQDSKT